MVTRLVVVTVSGLLCGPPLGGCIVYYICLSVCPFVHLSVRHVPTVKLKKELCTTFKL